MPAPMHRRLTPRRLVAIGLLAAVVALVLAWDWNWFKRPIEKRVEQHTGRRFAIGGDLDVDLGWSPRVTLDDVHLGNAPWARVPDMLAAERAQLTIDLRALIGGRLSLPDIALTAPRIALQNAPEGGNWQIATPPPEDREKGREKSAPQIGRLRIDRGVITYFDPADRTDIEVDVSTREGADPDRSLVMRAAGTLRGMDFEADAKGGPVLSLADAATPYPFDARLRAGSTRAHVEGTVTGLLAFTAARLQLEIQGDTLAALHPLTGLVLPETPPYHVAGRLVHQGADWTFEDFDGRVGDSDLSGSLTATYIDQRPRLVAKLRSRQLDLDDLAGMVGATPGTGPGETASPRQTAEAAAQEARPDVLPDAPVDLPQLRSMDADVEFEALSIEHERLPLDHLRTHLVLDHGRLTLAPLDFGVAGGRIESHVVLDAREPALGLDLRTNFSRLDLARLLPGNALVDQSTGLIGGRAVMKSRGRSTAELLGNADGELGVALRGGRFSNLLLEGAGLDGAEALGFLVRGDRTVKVRCAVLDLEARDGVFAPRAFVVDTTDTRINIGGTIDMRREKLDLTLHPVPKDFSPLTLRSPLHVRGTLKDPQVRPDRTLLLKGGVAAALGALVNPLAALLPLIETGPGRNADCKALVAAAERSARR